MLPPEVVIFCLLLTTHVTLSSDTCMMEGPRGDTQVQWPPGLMTLPCLQSHCHQGVLGKAAQESPRLDPGNPGTGRPGGLVTHTQLCPSPSSMALS